MALLIQLGSLTSIGLLLVGLWQFNQFKLTLPQALLAHVAVCLLLTRWCSLAWWWWVIQALFPLAIICMLKVALPPLAYFLVFAFLLFFYWSTFRTQVPYFPSTKPIWQGVDTLLPAQRPLTFLDIGSGLGGLVMYLAERHPESRFHGVEIAPLPWLVSYLRTLRHPAQFLLGNYQDLDFANYDVIFAYLSPAVMGAVWIKAKTEMRPGSMLISYEFPIEGVSEDLCICPDNGLINGAKIYIWQMK